MINYLHASCMDDRIGLPSMPDNSFDFAVCDPPYKIGASRPSKKPVIARQRNGSILKVGTPIYDHKAWDDALMPPSYFEHLHRVSKKVLIFGANYQDYPLRGGRLVWDKLNGNTDQYDCEIAYLSWTNRTEMVYYLWSGMFQGMTPSRNISIGYRQRGDKSMNEKRIHPTQKPVVLYEWILKEYANPGDKILDTHVGSGSSLVACMNLGFDCTGFEIDDDYYFESSKRINSIESRLI